VSTLDVAPTVAELLGLELQHAPSGSSLVPILTGNPTSELEEQDGFVHQEAHNTAVSLRQPPWKLIWKIDRDYPLLGAEPLLFNLDHDPHELTNLAEAKPELVAEMARSLEPWIALGRIERGATSHLDDEAIEQLRTLGYLPD
jgi:arylsulfatase A-like enzyme